MEKKWYDKMWFVLLMLMFFPPVGIYLMWKNEYFPKIVRIILTIITGFIFLLSVLAVFSIENEPTTSDDVIIEDSSENIKESKSNNKKKVDTKITADLEVKNTKDTVTLIVTTNAIDGSEFEYFIMNTDMDMETGFMSVKDGVAEVTVDIDDSWKPGYLAIGTNMRFNIDDRKQPEHVREAYGEHGEKLKGDHLQENNLDGYNISLSPEEPLAFPNEEVVRLEISKVVNEAFTELVNASDGVILSIAPTSNDWKVVYVKVSDAWYYSLDHEKERFANTIGDAVAQVVEKSGLAGKDSVTHVYFYDAYGKELASPKVMGGYKIKG